MRERQSLSRVRWHCRYYIVCFPKYRKRATFGAPRKDLGGILRRLCEEEGVEL